MTNNGLDFFKSQDVDKLQFLKTPTPNKPNSKSKWIIGDTEEDYKRLKKKSIYGPDDITYEFNNKGFRCDNFESWEKHPKRILFAGCSLTEGVGLPLEDSWPKILHTKICNEFNIKIPFWSIAKASSGVDHMVRYLYHYMDTLRPQFVVTLLPALARREREQGDYYIPKSIKKSDFKDAKLLTDYNFICYQHEKNFTMIQMIMEKYDSQFLYITSDNTKYNYGLDRVNPLTGISNNMEKYESDKARDGLHPGPQINLCTANLCFDFLLPRLKEKF